MNRELDFIDILGVMSFVIGLQNLELNVTQNDISEQTQDISRRADRIVKAAIEDIHKHLLMQDEKIDKILEVISSEDDKKIVRNDRV